MIEIEIDNTVISAQQGEMLITVADRIGVDIPRFCYHKKLSVAANCRMCLVEVEGAAKPMPACATPVADGMKVYTKSAKAKNAQKAVMDFLLINHPLDCPICDQGGECELQDVAVSYGNDNSIFLENKRVMPDKDIGPLVQTEMTRCIHCTRCVRFGAEVAGLTEMGGTGRGEGLAIETFLESGLESELSGNMIDICPVGALTSKPFRYNLRSWQMTSTPIIAHHDNVGSFLWAQSHDNNIKRISARENDDLNETWISDRDRFSYQGLEHKNRLLAPKIKIENQWQIVSWQVALDFAIKGLNKVISNYQAEQFAILASANASLEEFYLLNKFSQEIGSPHLDYRLKHKDFNPASNCASTIDFKELETSSYIVVIGGDTRFEQPMLNHRLRKASLVGADIVVINFAEFNFNFPLSESILVNPTKLANRLMAVLKALLLTLKQVVPDNMLAIEVLASDKNIANSLLNNDNSAIILGEQLALITDYSLCVQIVKNISKLANTGIINASMKANSGAANFAGILPKDNNGYNVKDMFANPLKAYLLLDTYTEYDCAYPQEAYTALKNADFVVALNSFQSDITDDYANVILPIASNFESAGTHINLLGEQIFSTAAGLAPAEVKPAWKVIKVLADLLGLHNFDNTDIKSIATEAVNLSRNKQEYLMPIDEITPTNTTDEVVDIWQINPYCADVLLRHADSLQKTKIASYNVARMNTKTAKKLAKDNNDTYKYDIPIVIDEQVADNCVFSHYNSPMHTLVD